LGASSADSSPAALVSQETPDAEDTYFPSGPSVTVEDEDDGL
jgi:hypothetical protein